MTTETIQLLTPEGERAENPEYPLGDVDIRGMYRDMVLVRRIDNEAVALQRQGELGLWPPLLGQEAAQIGSGRALSPRDMAFPSYREHGVAGAAASTRSACSSSSAASTTAAGTRGAQVPPLHDRHRRPDPARHRLRDGHQERRGRGRGGDRLLRRRRDQPGRRQRGVRLVVRFNAPVVFFCQNNQWAISAPAVGRAAPRSTSGQAASASPASRSTATTCSPATR